MARTIVFNAYVAEHFGVAQPRDYRATGERHDEHVEYHWYTRCPGGPEPEDRDPDEPDWYAQTDDPVIEPPPRQATTPAGPAGPPLPDAYTPKVPIGKLEHLGRAKRMYGRDYVRHVKVATRRRNRRAVRIQLA